MKFFLFLMVIILHTNGLFAQQDALYLGCGNTVYLAAEKYGIPQRDFIVKAQGADLEKSSHKNTYIVNPKRSSVTLFIYNQLQLIDEIPFQVIALPKPSLIIKQGDQLIKFTQNEQISFFESNLSLILVADEALKEAVPHDTRYRITKFVVTLARDRQAIAAMTFHKPNVDLKTLFAQALPNDRLVIEIKEAKRMDYKGRANKIRVPMDYQIITLFF